jgi:outer membrane receptor protein involved in Fe transport
MKKWVVLVVSVLSVSGSIGVAAQSASTASSNAQDASSTQLEEVIVTAQKRKQLLKDVPISIVAISGDELMDRHITALEDLPNAVPGLGYTNAGNSRYIEIRGVSNIVGSSALVGIYIDDTDATLGGASTVQTNPITFDLERVEVLRGPQGTLYGEGSAGGTVRFITKNPNLSHFAVDTDIAAMFTESGDPSQRINAMVNVPLIDGQLALRVAGTFQHDGGWIDQPAAQRENINYGDLTNVRIKGLWQPSAQLSVLGMVIINRNTRGMDFSDGGSPGQFTQRFYQTTSPEIHADYDLYSLTVTYDIGSFGQLTNVLGYMRAPLPQYAVPAFFQTEPDLAPGTVFDYYVPLQNISEHLLTDELRLSSVGTGPWQWTIGGFFRRYDDSVAAPENYFDFPGPPSDPLPPPYGYAQLNKLKSWSVFLDTSYQLSDGLTLGAGVRATHETQDFTDFTTNQNGTFHTVDPRVYAQFKLTPEVNVYASAAKGSRGGGFNAFGAPQYDPEKVWTYELGTKMSFSNRLDFDADVFLSNYSDYQTFAPIPGALLFSAIQNVGYARIKGVEADATWRPVAHWRFDLRGNYVDAKFQSINSGSTAYLPGDRIDLVPKYQFGVSAEHVGKWLGKTVVSRLDYSQQGPATYRNRTTGPWYFNESDVIDMLNFNANFEWSEDLSVGVFAHNLLNDQGFANPYAIIGNGVRSRPMTFGVDFTASFH